MKRFLAFVLIILCLGRPVAGSAAPAPHTGGRLLMAHYMPWFEADPAHARWGWHWTMNHYAPAHEANGRREAASHYTPLIGLYDSNDPDVLECAVDLKDKDRLNNYRSTFRCGPPLIRAEKWTSNSCACP